MGKLVGMNFDFLAFSFIIVQFRYDKFRVTTNNNLFLSFGVTKMHFKNALTENKIKTKLFWYYAGGPVMNLFCSIIAGLILITYKGNLLLIDITVYIFIFNLLIFVITSIPFEETDGFNIVKNINKQEKEIAIENQIYSLHSKSVDQITLEDIHWLKIKFHNSNISTQIFLITLILVNYYLNNGDRHQVKNIIDEGLSKLSMKDYMVFKVILLLYTTLLKFSNEHSLDNKDINRLRYINFWYGITMSTIAGVVIEYLDNKEKDPVYLKKFLFDGLTNGLSKSFELLDIHQEEILKSLITSILKESPNS
ncbi:hypothetical protein HF072_04365 [Bacillus sp. RO3]|nr:hypothetical protein [Bacillus sp. RO3]